MACVVVVGDEIECGLLARRVSIRWSMTCNAELQVAIQQTHSQIVLKTTKLCWSVRKPGTPRWVKRTHY